ncbi:asparaginase [Natrialbaceae archaeon A-CW1-1]
MNTTVLSTGGTIASTHRDSGAEPTQTGDQLVETVPELKSYATLTVEDIAQVPSYEMNGKTLEKIGKRVSELDADPVVDIIIITHGTDTLEETAYYIDVTVQPETPVILTGAQRRPDEVSSDGPSNLLTAVRAGNKFAEHNAGGTFVAFNEEVHSARSVTKTHTTALETFQSTNTGPVATVDRHGVEVHRPPRSETQPIEAASLEATIFTIKSGSNTTGKLVRAALKHGVQGLVIEGTGLGNTTAGLAEAIREALESGIPVVVTSRCLGGRVEPVYGGDGGGKRLREYGAIFADHLSAQQARLRLSLVLEVYHDSDEIRKAFATT